MCSISSSNNIAYEYKEEEKLRLKSQHKAYLTHLHVEQIKSTWLKHPSIDEWLELNENVPLKVLQITLTQTCKKFYILSWNFHSKWTNLFEVVWEFMDMIHDVSGI